MVELDALSWYGSKHYFECSQKSNDVSKPRKRLSKKTTGRFYSLLKTVNALRLAHRWPVASMNRYRFGGVAQQIVR